MRNQLHFMEPMFIYCVYNSLPFLPVLSKVSPDHNIPSLSLGYDTFCVHYALHLKSMWNA